MISVMLAGSRNIVSKEFLQFVQGFREHFDRIVHVKQIFGLVFVVPLLVNEDFLRKEACRIGYLYSPPR